MGPNRRSTLLGALLLGTLLALATALDVEAQGPFSAQIVRALQAFLVTPHTWTALQTFSGGVVASGAASGTCATPSYTFVGNTTAGIGWLGTNNVAGCANGATIFDWNASRVLFAQPIYLPDGALSAGAMVFGSQTGLGFLKAATSVIGVVGAYSTAANAIVLDATSTPMVRVASGGLIGFGSTGDALSPNDIAFARCTAGQLKIFKDSTHGVCADVNTDGTIQFLSRAGADTAILKANVITPTGSITFAPGTASMIGTSSYVVDVGGGSNFQIRDQGNSKSVILLPNGTSTFSLGLSAAVLQGSGTGTSVANVGANSCGTTAATIAGNQVSGVITVGATAGTQCRVTFTTAAPVARDCTVTDSTTTIATRATVVDTTNHDFLGAFVAGDKITYQCTVR